MSVKAMAWVWDQEIDRDGKFVLLAYADHADHEGGNIFPAVLTIAKKTGYSERSVQRITKKLIEEGWLIEDGISRLQTNKYHLPYKGGDKMSPLPMGGDKRNGGGCQNDTGGVTKTTPRGDTAMTPEPSLTIIKPSVEEEFSTSSFIDVSSQIMPMIARVSGMVYIPDQSKIEPITRMIEVYGLEKTEDELKKQFAKWRSTKRKDNSGSYRPTNMGWVDWAQDELVGKPPEKKFEDCTTVDEMIEWHNTHQA